MTSVPLDPQGDASRALATAVEDFGPRALSSPVVLANLFKDLLPDSPRETTVLVAVAEAGLAKAITDRVEQGLPPDSATYQAATIVADARAMDPAAVHWAARQFATVLGYRVAPSDVETAGSGAAERGVVATPGWPAPVAQAPGWQAPGAPASPPAPGPNPWDPPAPAWPGVPGQPAAGTAPGYGPPGGGGQGFGPPGGEQPPAGGTTPGRPTTPGMPAGPPQPGAPGGFPPGGATPISVQPTEVVTPATGGWGAAPWAPGTPPNAPTPTGPPAGGYGAAPGPWTPGSGGWTPPPNQPTKSRTPWYLGGAAVVAVIVAVVVVIVVSSGGSKSHSAATVTSATTTPTSVTTTPPTSTTIPPTVTTTPVTVTLAPAPTVTTAVAPTSRFPNLTAAQAKLAAVLPIDIDPNTACQTQTDLPTGLVNVAAALGCTGPSADGADPGLPGSDIFAYQFTTPATFQAGLSQYNKDKNFDPTTAGDNCPPTASADDGSVTWNNPSKTLSGDLECFSVSNSGAKATMPVYIWTITSHDAIVEAVGSATTTFAQLDSWFLDHNSPR